jgi:hypothetical protein
MHERLNDFFQPSQVSPATFCILSGNIPEKVFLRIYTACELWKYFKTDRIACHDIKEIYKPSFDNMVSLNVAEVYVKTTC